MNTRHENNLRHLRQEHQSMERILKVRDYIDHFLDIIPSVEERKAATIHTFIAIFALFNTIIGSGIMGSY